MQRTREARDVLSFDLAGATWWGSQNSPPCQCRNCSRHALAGVDALQLEVPSKGLQLSSVIVTRPLAQSTTAVRYTKSPAPSGYSLCLALTLVWRDRSSAGAASTASLVCCVLAAHVRPSIQRLNVHALHQRGHVPACGTDAFSAPAGEPASVRPRRGVPRAARRFCASSPPD